MLFDKKQHPIYPNNCCEYLMDDVSVSKIYPYDFDEFSSVEYKDISRLYYGKYPYKVLVRGGWYDTLSRNSLYFKHLKETCKHYNKSLWYVISNSRTFSFFFVKKQHAKDFIKKHKEHIYYVHRARNEKEIEILNSHPRRELRQILYWNRFKYAVDFYEIPDNDHLDEEIHRLFPKKRKNSARFRLIMNKKRRLLLNDENDLLYVYMALSDKIEKQSEAILRNKIDEY